MRGIVVPWLVGETCGEGAAKRDDIGFVEAREDGVAVAGGCGFVTRFGAVELGRGVLG